MRLLERRTIACVVHNIQAHAHVAASHEATAIEGAYGVHALRIIVQILHGHHLRQQVTYVSRRTAQLVLLPVETVEQVNVLYSFI